MKSLIVYNTVKELVAKAVDPVKPSMVRNHAKNRDKLDESFYEVCYNWETWKEDLGLSDTDFNETEDNVAKYNYNDSWMEKFKEDYCDLAEKSEQKLTGGTAPAEEAKGSKVAIENEIKLKQDKKFAETLADQIEALTTNISASIDKINSEVIKMDDGGESPARIQSLKSDLHALDDKIDSSLISLINQYINLLNEQEVLEKKSMKTEFINKEKPRIANLLLILSQKVKDISPSAAGNSHSTHDKKDQTTFLKKAEPPKWTGDPIDFADFMRKWKSLPNFLQKVNWIG